MQSPLVLVSNGFTSIFQYVINAVPDSGGGAAGRDLSRQARSLDDLAAQPPGLRQVHAAIRSSLPEAREKISWSMPTYWKGRNLIQFAASKRHIGLYPGPEAVEAFAGRLTDYKTSKGTIQLPYSKPLPLELIAEIAKWCGETN